MERTKRGLTFWQIRIPNGNDKWWDIKRVVKTVLQYRKRNHGNYTVKPALTLMSLRALALTPPCKMNHSRSPPPRYKLSGKTRNVRHVRWTARDTKRKTVEIMDVFNNNKKQRRSQHVPVTLSLSSRRANPTTVMPCSTSALHTAAPIPADAPVTIATFSAHLSIGALAADTPYCYRQRCRRSVRSIHARVAQA